MAARLSDGPCYLCGQYNETARRSPAGWRATCGGEATLVQLADNQPDAPAVPGCVSLSECPGDRLQLCQFVDGGHRVEHVVVQGCQDPQVTAVLDTIGPGFSRPSE